jgi:predicted lipid carrier protein YhbT
MCRWLPPLEGDRRLIETLHRSRPQGVDTEVFVFGKLPLAFSARCFTARHYNLNKDDCQFKCLDHLEGLTLRTREGQPFLTLNGIQTMSAQTYNLLPQIPELLAMGIEVARLSPQPKAMPAIIAAFDAARRGQRVDVDSSGWASDGVVDGYWFADAGIVCHQSGAAAHLQGNPVMSFSIPRFKLPGVLTTIGARLPQWPHSLALASALNVAARVGLLPDDSLALLEGRSFLVEVLDAGGQACFCYRDGLFRPLFTAPASPDLSFRANLSAFLQLLARQEDPDTLFFNRELSIVGDTELGLVIKNMLDAIEWPQLPTLPIFRH